MALIKELAIATQFEQLTDHVSSLISEQLTLMKNHAFGVKSHLTVCRTGGCGWMTNRAL